MNKIDMKQWVRETIEGKRRRVVPIMTHPGIEMCGYQVVDAVRNGEIHAEAILKLNETYPADAATVIMDLTVEAEAFGAAIRFPENEVPSVTERLVCDRASVEALCIPSLAAARIPEYLKANNIVAMQLKKPLFGGCIGPFSLAGRLFDMSEMMMALYTEPETIELLLDKCTEFITTYCRAIKQSGSAGVIIAEPAAGLISNEDCETYSSRYVRRIVEAVQDDHFLVVLHNCGNTGHCTQAMVASGCGAYHFGNQCDMAGALAECPAEVLVMGNLDPVGVFKQASAEQVERATTELLQATSAYSNYVLSSGCDIPPAVPRENIRAFYDALATFNKSR